MIPTTQDAFRSAAAVFGVEVNALYGPERSARLVRPRFAAWLIARDLLDRTYPEIARHARRDHTTVVHGCRRAAAFLADDPDFAAAFAEAHARTNEAAAPLPVFRTRRTK